MAGFKRNVITGVQCETCSSEPRTRRRFLAACGAVIGWSTVAGCTSPAIRSQSPADDELESNTHLVGEYAVPFGLVIQKVEGIALVTGLPGTGDDTPPTPQRQVLLRDLEARGVPHPQQLLASPATTMVLVRGFIRPGAQKGDFFDLEVRVPSTSECRSLRGGWMMETRLTEAALIDGQIYDGHLIGEGKGPILVDPAADATEDRTLAGRGRVLGGGRVLKPRPIGLALKPDHQNLRTSAAIGAAINRRFHTFHEGRKTPVATPKSAEYIELLLDARYKNNVPRYMQVLRAIALRESSSERLARLALLERQLLDPITASSAALRLEAIGKEAIDVLKKGVASRDPEVQFYSAEALAYLDEPAAAPPLANAAREQPAFRVFALTALSAMDDYAAYEELRKLLDEVSAETRYGAFRALWAMNRNDPLVRGEMMNDQFSYHILHAGGPPMIHATRSFRPELVVFGNEQRLKAPFTLDAAHNKIMVTAKADGLVTVTRFNLNGVDQKREVDTTVDAIVRAIADLGGDYPDVVQILQQAKQADLLSGRFEVDALPEANRRYERQSMDDAQPPDVDESSPPAFEVTNASPELFSNPGETKPHRHAKRNQRRAAAEEPSRWQAFLAKMKPGGADD